MLTSKELFKRRAQRSRYKLKKHGGGKPRLSVFRSARQISVQLIDDIQGVTIASASTLEKDIRSAFKNGGNSEAAAAVGKAIAERAKKAGVEVAIFDRGGYKYHGRIKALADAAREAGLQI